MGSGKTSAGTDGHRRPGSMTDIQRSPGRPHERRREGQWLFGSPRMADVREALLRLADGGERTQHGARRNHGSQNRQALRRRDREAWTRALFELSDDVVRRVADAVQLSQPPGPSQAREEVAKHHTPISRSSAPAARTRSRVAQGSPDSGLGTGRHGSLEDTTQAPPAEPAGALYHEPCSRSGTPWHLLSA